MLGLDERIAALSGGDAVLVVVAVAILLGLRHATDPDHLTAVSTLIASDDERGARRAGILGFSWGLGHATTLFAFGLPIVLFRSYLPEAVQRAAEVAIGFVIIGLALRLLARWRAGRFHSHAHRHGIVEHRHLHDHVATTPQARAHDDSDVGRGLSHGHRDASPHGHIHQPDSRLGRSPLQAYGIGLVHGMGGSAGVGVLLLASISDHVVGVLALLLFALCTAASMALASSSLGFALTREPMIRRFVTLVPVLGAASLVFGVWYVLGALDAVPYPL